MKVGALWNACMFSGENINLDPMWQAWDNNRGFNEGWHAKCGANQDDANTSVL